jgi:hypothetical protein
MRKFGIYLCYAPEVELEREGLGRHLGEFLKGAYERDDVRFVIACPSWHRAKLSELCKAHGLDPDAMELISPAAPPLLLTALRKYEAYRTRRTPARRRARRGARLRDVVAAAGRDLERRVAGTRTILGAAWWISILFLFLLAGTLVQGAIGGLRALRRLMLRFVGRTLRRTLRAGNRLRRAVLRRDPNQLRESLLARLTATMVKNEAVLLDRLIGARKDIVAWYSPAAFWPSFNTIAAPRLMCVPDVVVSEFPVGFVELDGSNLGKSFDEVEAAIEGCEHFATYSERTKWESLVRHYGARPDSVFVIRHGAVRLDGLIRTDGFANNAAATDTLCRKLLVSALAKDLNQSYGGIRVNKKLRFIFYASQFRPNKNILNLLRAYEFLLRRHFIGHKLILTGMPREPDDIARFINDRNLRSDVLCLRGLTERELAACYYLADLAVNPSLSEGGFPFTFTEAMSVGTPVVMARIQVTEEIVTDPGLQSAMLFDPFDWKDMAARIEFGLHNRDKLLALQQPLFEQLAQRSWRNVVDDYVAVLDRISRREGDIHAPV